LYFYV